MLFRFPEDRRRWRHHRVGRRWKRKTDAECGRTVANALQESRRAGECPHRPVNDVAPPPDCSRNDVGVHRRGRGPSKRARRRATHSLRVLSLIRKKKGRRRRR